jgi:hypothetical protein
MANTQIDVNKNGVVTLATAGKYCDRNIDINVNVEETYIVPSYWQSYLDAKAAEIDTALNAAGENRSAFLWYTDAHWTTNYGQSPMLLKYLSKHTGMTKTFFGGDIANDKTGEIDTLRAWQAMVADVPNHHSVIGNHDNQITDLPTGLGDFFLVPERTGDVVFGTDATNGKNYYYIDNHIENTRYICLSTGRMWTHSDEVQWCVEVLSSTPANWHIVVVSHLWLDNNYDVSPVVPLETPESYTQVFLDLFDSYNYRESGTTSFASTAYDFTNAKGKVEFVIGGHIHQDYDFATAKGIPVILTECDGSGERDAVSVATKGTTTENCVYAIVADYAAKQVKVINVGRGDTRIVEISDVVTYKNVLKTAIDTDGSLFNGGKGYVDNYRLDGATTVAYTGRDTTGYIYAKRGDVIGFKNVTFKPHHHIYCSRYTSTFGFHSYSGFDTADKLSAWSPVFDDDGNVIQLTIASAISSSCVYFRFTVQDINEDSIITVNEEIT